MVLGAGPAGLGVGREPLDLAGQVEEREAVGAADHRHQQPLVGGGGDADVPVLLDDDLAGRLVERGVELGVGLQRRHHRLDHEGQEGELHPLGLGAGRQPVLEADQLGHVALLHEGEVGGGPLGERHLLGDLLADAAQRDPLVGAARDPRHRAALLRPGRPPWLEGLQVLLGDPAAVAAPGHLLQVERQLPGQGPDRRGGQRPGAGRARRGGRARGRGAAGAGIAAGRAARRGRGPVAAGRAAAGAAFGPRPRRAASSSSSMSAEWTLAISPSFQQRRSTRPRFGDGMVTVALSVITSTSGWSSATSSPSATNHFMISASTTPSPMSGSSRV